ncbi:unnamed protein product [Rotaria sordida]|uniref:Staphylococcus aureus surface protein A n=1 Tax=Rotaria sordida TaxID=392033 RepID=A0A814IKY2_9BILA|nr:unnamed protein product [Rotaria sordida]
MSLLISILYQTSLLIILVSTQVVQRNIPDLFYYANFNGPIFDQPVYKVTASNFSIVSPINTTLFIFSLEPQTQNTIPTYVPLNRALNSVADIQVTWADTTFFIEKLSNFSYRVATNISPLNYFSPYHRYLFTITATQSFPGRPSISSTAIAQIDLNYCNAHAPTFIYSNQTYSISETQRAGLTFGTVFATDADKDPVTFALTPASSQFIIDRSTGVLSLSQTFQTTPSSPIFLTVTATDVPSSSCSLPCPSCIARSNSTTITIIVITANKQPPKFSDQPCNLNISLREDSLSGTNITTLTATDNDQGNNGRISFSFPPEQQQTKLLADTNDIQSRSTFYSKFQLYQFDQINETRTVQLRMNETFDYDQLGATRVWYLFILASDQGTPTLQSLCTLRINLIEVNEYAPVFTSTIWNQTIYSTTGSTVMRVIATDLDAGVSGMINYFMVSSPQQYFVIESSTGIIRFASGVTVSNVNPALFPVRFTVFAQDRGSPSRMSSSNATVEIYLASNNTIPPVQWLNPSNGELNLNISEKYFETSSTQLISDSQNGFNGSILYRSNSQQSNLFYVSNSFPTTTIPFRAITPTVSNSVFTSGILVTSGLDAETQAIYLLTLLIASNPPLLGWATINLSDENDEIPQFSIRSLELNILATQTGTRLIGQFLAFDRDLTSPNNRVQYRINDQLTDEITRNRFFLLADGTVGTNVTFDRQNRSTYRIIITAFDGAPAWSMTTNNTEDFQLDINIVDNNDLPPVFNQTTANISIDESTTIGTSIYNITVTDSNPYSILNFGILSGNIKNVFTFVKISDNGNDASRTEYRAIGQLIAVGPLDYVDQRIYTLVLFAFDTNNLATINVIVNVLSNNANAPYFLVQSNVYQIEENRPVASLNTDQIIANDSNPSILSLKYSVVSNDQQILRTIFLNESNNRATIGIASPGLIRDAPFGRSTYRFALRVTNQNGTGVSSYAPVTIDIIDINNNGPIPIASNLPWIMNEGIQNPSISIVFRDFDDSSLNNTIPFSVRVLEPSTFEISPTLNNNDTFTLRYNGILSRTEAKNLTVKIMSQDVKGISVNTSIPIIVGDIAGNDPISNGLKTINVLYAEGYENSLQNVDLGSVYVVNTDDWFLANNIYSVTNVSRNQIFQINQGFLRTPSPLSVGTYTIVIQVTKSLTSSQSTASSSINMEVAEIDIESIREAATIRIQGETPETLVDLSFGNRLDRLREVLASILTVSIDSIRLLTIRSVPQYRHPIYPPLSFDEAKRTALTDVIFSVLSSTRGVIENTVNNNLPQLTSRSGLTVNATGPNPCRNYVCPSGTICSASRSIQPFPLLIDTNLTSFVGINIIDSPDCVNSTWRVSPQMPLPSGCSTFSFNDAIFCPCTDVQSLGPLGTYCAVLGRTFLNTGSSYAVFDGTTFSNLAPARFSFDFVVPNISTVGLLLLYGREIPPIDDYFWLAIELINSNRLRFHFRDHPFFDTNLVINASKWYHVEYQYVADTILVMINDEQYDITVNNNSINNNNNNQSLVRLYLGGLPRRDSPINALYPALSNVDSFRGCIRNVRSNGVYLDMNRPIFASDNSRAGLCDCLTTDTCTTGPPKDATGVIVPCYTDRIGEEDNISYNLGILRKPVYTVSNEEILNEHLNMNNRGYTNSTTRESLGNFIDQKLRKQPIVPRLTDTMLFYAYEGTGQLESMLIYSKTDRIQVINKLFI